MNSKRPAPAADESCSPPASKCCKQSSVTFDNIREATVHISSAAGRRRDRLRQQLKSRDVMIYEMQVLILII